VCARGENGERGRWNNLDGSRHTSHKKATSCSNKEKSVHGSDLGEKIPRRRSPSFELVRHKPPTQTNLLAGLNRPEPQTANRRPNPARPFWLRHRAQRSCGGRGSKGCGPAWAVQWAARWKPALKLGLCNGRRWGFWTLFAFRGQVGLSRHIFKRRWWFPPQPPIPGDRPIIWNPPRPERACPRRTRRHPRARVAGEAATFPDARGREDEIVVGAFHGARSTNGALRVPGGVDCGGTVCCSRREPGPRPKRKTNEPTGWKAGTAATFCC